MRAHTPGPWWIDEQYIFAGRDFRVICQWASYTREANAKLICAAPELYKALEAAVEELELLGNAEFPSKVLKAARIALAKVKQ